jgi:cobalt-zinc-cadmium efflux system protein
MHEHHHHHGHSHGHHHAHHREFSISIFFNLVYVIVQVIFAYQSNSMSLLADGWHNLSDVLGLSFAWAASFLHTRPPSERFSYGFKRTTIIASLANALFLVATSAVIGYQSILKILHPEPIQAWTVIIVAAIGILVNGGTALLFLKGRKKDLNLKGAWLHLLGDALISFGVVVTAFLVAFTGIQQLDGIACLLIVVIIIISTWSLLRESINLLLDAVPASANQEEIKDYLEQIPGVTQVHDLHIWALSTKETAMTAHLVMPEIQLTDQDFVRIYKELKDHHQIDHTTLQIEKGELDSPCPQAESC